jgi:hypothetical protein
MQLFSPRARSEAAAHRLFKVVIRGLKEWVRVASGIKNRTKMKTVDDHITAAK